jgi:hypothetical protein
MELLLNFLWLMLVLPAFLVWRYQLSALRHPGKRHQSRSLVLLGCLLVLLFPVVSASDDLHPISAEIEESGPFKRTVKQSPGINAAIWTHHASGAALPARVFSIRPQAFVLGAMPAFAPSFAGQPPVLGSDSRGPPAV